MMNGIKDTAIIIVVASMVLSSCARIEFKEASPKKGKILEAFPKEIIGKYISNNDKDTLIIERTHFRYGDKDSFLFLSGDISDMKSVLKKMGEYLILSTKEAKDENWEVIPFSYSKNRIAIFYLTLDKEGLNEEELIKYKKKKLEMLASITNVKKKSGTKEKTESYLIDPNDKQFEEIINKGLFEKIIEFKRIY